MQALTDIEWETARSQSRLQIHLLRLAWDRRRLVVVCLKVLVPVVGRVGSGRFIGTYADDPGCAARVRPDIFSGQTILRG